MRKSTRSSRQTTRRIRLATRAKRKAPRFILTAAFALFLPTAVSKATMYWDSDADGTNGILGGTGTWDTVASQWDIDTNNTNNNNAVWSNASFETASFGGTAGTVTLGTTITAGALDFTTSGYEVTGNTLTLAPAAGVPSPFIKVGTAIGDRAIISSIVAGTAGFTKTGNGTLVLTNTGNTVSGDVAIKAGTVVITDTAQLGAGTTAVSVTGIANTGNPGYTGGSLLLSGGMTLSREVSGTGRGPGAVNNTGAVVSVGNNTIAGGLVLGSAGAQGNINATYGTTTVSGGVYIGNTNSTNVSSTIFFGNGNFIVSGQVTGNDTGAAANDDFIKSGIVYGTTLWLQNAANNLNQSLRIDSGTVRVSTNSALGTNVGTQALDMNGGRLEIRTDSPNFATRNVNIRGNTSQIFVDRAIGGTGLNQTVVFGNLNNSAANGGLTMEGRNGYNMTITGPSGTISWTNGGTLTFTNNANGLYTINASINRLSEGTARTLTIAGNGDTLLTGSILQAGTGAVSLTKNNAGMVTIQGVASTATGATNITDGTLSIGDFTSLPSGQINIGGGTNTAGALLYTGGNAVVTRTLALSATSAQTNYIYSSGTGALSLTGTFTNVNSGAKTLVLGGTAAFDNTVSSVLTNTTHTSGGVLSLQKTGSGRWVLTPTASNTLTGATTISNGTLRLQEAAGNFDILPDAAAVTFNVDTFNQTAGATLDYAGASGVASTETAGALTLTAGGNTITVSPGAAGTAALTFASLGTRTAGATLNIAPAAGGTVGFTAAAGANGILGGFATFNGVDWVNSGTAATQFTTYTVGLPTSGSTATVNYSNAGSVTTTAAQSINSLKLSGAQTVTLGGTLTVTSGGILFDNSTGAATITGSQLGATNAELMIHVNGITPANALTINSLTGSGTSPLTKSGNGVLILGGTNVNTGTVTVNAGTLQVGTGGTLAGTNAGLVVRQGATLDLNGSSLGTMTTGGGNLLNGAGTITNTAAATTSILRVGNGSSSGYFSGLINDGAGKIALSKGGTGTLSLSGTNTFSGGVQITGGVLAVTSLANIGVASGIGAGDATDATTNAASLIFSGGTLTYTGATATISRFTQTPSVSIDRLFTLAGDGTISSEGSYGSNRLVRNNNNATLIFNNTLPVVHTGAAPRTLTLQGDSIGDNSMGLQLVDGAGTAALSITKSGTGLWILGNATNSYTGVTTITGGALRAQDGGSLPSVSNLLLNGGVFESTGTFARTSIGTGANQLRFGQFANSGFSSGDTKLTVNFSSLGTPIWGSTTDFLSQGILLLNSATSIADVEVTGSFDIITGSAATPTVTATGTAAATLDVGSTAALTIGQTITGTNIPANSYITAINSATRFTINQNVTVAGTSTSSIAAGGWREVQVQDNTSTNLDYATISSNIGGTGGLAKGGGEDLILSGASTYSGKTVLRNEALFVTSIGAAGATASNLGTNVGGGVLEIGNPGAGNTARLMYVGPGETTTRQINLVGTTGTRGIDSSGSGPLILTALTNSSAGASSAATGARTLNIRGTNVDGNMITSVLGNDGTNVLTVTKEDGGVWILNPSSANTFTGAINANGGTLGLTANGIGSAASISITNGAIMGFGAPLTIGVGITQPNNTTAVFSGVNAITINGAITKGAGGNDNTISNNLEGGALLTVNGTYTNDSNARTLNLRGSGSWVWNGVISNGTGTNGVSIAIHPDASFTFGGTAANTYSGTTTLSQGNLILSKTLGTAQIGTGTSQFNFGGGVLQSNVGALTGGNALANNIFFTGDPATFAGTDFDFTGNWTNNAGNRLVVANVNLTHGTGVVNLSNDNTGRTLTVLGSGAVALNGVVQNGGTSAGGLTYSGTGAMTLTANNTATGTLTVNRNTVTLQGASGDWDGPVTINATGTLTLNNAANENTNRVADAGAVTFGGGTLNFVGDGDGTSETFGAMVVNGTDARITMSGAGPNTLTFASVNMPNTGSTLELLGVPSLGSTNKVIFTSATGLTLVPATTGIANRAVIGSDFATYNGTDGVRSFTNYNPTSATDINAAGTTDTVEVNAGMTSASLTASKVVNALKINGSGLTVGGATLNRLTLTAAGVLNVGGNNTISVPELAFAGNVANIQVASGTTLTVSGALSGTGGWIKSQAGSLQLNAPMFLSGTTNINSGTVVLNGGTNTLFQNQILNINTGATLDLFGNTQFVERIQGTGGLPGGSGNITNTNGGTPTLLTNMGASTVFGGQILDGTGVTNFARVNGNTLTFQMAQPYTGSTLLMGGTTTLENDATLLGTSAIDLNSATLNISNNTGLQTSNNNRIGDSIPLTLRSGTITYTGRTATLATETLGALSLAQGANTVSVSVGGGTFGSAALTFASLSRSAGTTLNFGAGALGQTGNSANVTFTSPLTALGSGVLGAWAIANSTDYAAYNSGMGVGIVGQGGYTGYDGAFGAGNITELQAANAANSTTLPAGTTNAALLKISGGFQNDVFFTGGSDVLNLSLGGILRSNNNAATLIGTTATRGVITSGTNELVVFNNAAGTTNFTGDGVTGTTSGSAVINLTSTTGLTPGMTITNANIPTGTYVVSVNSPTQITVSQNATATATGGTFVGGTSNLIVNSVIQGGSTALVKSGAGVLNLSANNTYGGGTFVSQGTVNLIGSGVVIPAGGITLTGASLIANTNAGQIDATNAVTLNASSTLTVLGNSTLDSLSFNNNGGTGTPTVNTGGILTLTNATPITVSSSNPLTVATINGSIDIGTGSKTLNIPAVQVAGNTVTNITPTLNIAAGILSPGVSITKAGAGVLQVGGQSTYTGGTTLSQGGILIAGNSTPTSGGAGITTGPLGSGSVSAASGTTLLVDGTARTIANDIVFAGTPTFDSSVNAATSLTLNGELTGAGLAAPTPTVNINAPFMTVFLRGEIPNIASITSFNKTGLGTLVFNATGYTGDFNAAQLGNPTAVQLLHDGNSPNIGNGVVETINLGDVIFDAGVVGTITVDRAGGTLPFGLAANKIINPDSINTLGNGLTVINSNGYGLEANDSVSLTNTPTFSVIAATASNVTQGLYMTGVLGGTGFNKTSAGTIVLGNASNTFTGDINVQQGVVSISADGQLGNAGNDVRLNPTTGTATLRATGSITTSRTIQLSNTSFTRSIEVSAGNTLQLDTPFDLNAGGGTGAALTKADNGTLAINADNSATGWNGVLTITQGAVLVMNDLALGTTTGSTIVNASGAAVRLGTGIALAEPLTLNGTGILTGGALQAVGNTNQNGLISLASASAIGADSGMSMQILGGIGTANTTAQALTFVGAGSITIGGTAINTGVASITKIGSGSLELGNTNSLTGPINVNRGTVTLSGLLTAGTGTANAILVNQGGSVTVDAGTGSHRYSNRAVTLAGGTFNYTSNTASPFTGTSTGVLTFNSGGSTIAMTNAGASTTTVVFGSLAFGGGSTGNITGLNTSSNLLKLTTTPTLVPATTGILARLTVDGNEFATYNGTGVAGNGIVAFTGYSAATNILSAGVTQTFRATPSTANSLTGNQTINALTLSTGAGALSVGAVSGLTPTTMTLTSGGILVNGTGTTASLSVPVVSFGATGTTEGIIHVAGGQTLNVTSGLVTTGGLTKALGGTLNLDVQQFVSGTTTVNGGTVNLNSATNTLLFNNALTVNTGGTVNLGGNVQYIANLASQGAGTNNDIGGGIVTGTGATLVTNANSTFGGDIQGITFLNKAGTGTLTLTNAQSYTGGTLITGGALTLSDSGSILNTTGTIEIYGATLNFTNTGISDLSNRVGNNAIEMRAGTLNFAGRAQTNSSETLGAVTLLGSGHNTIFANDADAGVGSGVLTLASLARGVGSTAILRFNNAGDFGLIGTRGRVLITSAPSLSNNILGPWSIVDREYTSYDSTYGIGALSTVGFAGYAGSGINTNPLATDNVRFAIPAGTTFLEGNTVVNTLNISQSANSTLDLNGNTLRLQGGGLLIGQNTDNTTQTISNGTITSGMVGSPSDLYLIHAAFDNDARNSVITAAIADNGVGGAVRLILGNGDGTTSTLTLNGTNTYTGGTIINQGVKVLGASGTLGTGGITVDVATFNQTLGGTIPSQQLTMNGGSVVTLANQANSLTNLVISNNGGAAPTLTPTGTLTLTGGISTSSIAAAVIPTIGAGTIDLNGNGSFSINVGAATVNGNAVAPWQSDLTINSLVQNGSIVKTGTGNLLLGNQNSTFADLTVNAGGIIIGASSVDSIITSSPTGTGTVTMADNTSMLSSGAFTITNNVIFNGTGGIGTHTFNGLNNLTLNGITTLPLIEWNATVTAPQMTVTIGDVVVGNGTTDEAAHYINKAGLGILNVGNYIGTLQATGGLVFTADGNTLGTQEAISLGGGVVLTGDTAITVNRSGSAPNARNKAIQKATLSVPGNIMAVSNLNGYGLEITGATTMTGPSHYAVSTATASNVVQGLTLTGAVDDGASNFGIIKSGPGTLVLNGTNTFGAAGQTIDILNGVVSVNSDGSLGDAANTVTLNVDASTGVGLRATGTFSTARTIVLAQPNNALEATAGNVLTLSTAFSVSTASNTLTKNDNGVVEITADNTGWTGAVTINAGALRAGHNSALGSGAVTINNAQGSALQLTGGVSISNPITLVANGASGFDTRGAIESVSGVNTIATSITQTSGSAVTIGAGAGATLNINGGVASGNSITFAAGAGGTVNLNSVYGTGTGGPTFNKIGTGSMNITANQTMGSAINVNNGTLTVTGSGVTLGNSVGTATSLITINAPATLVIDDSAGAPSSHMGNRNITLQGGTLTYTGNAANSAEVSTGVLTFARGGGVLISNPASGANNSLTFASLGLGNETNADFQGTGMGTASNLVIFTTAPTLVGNILARATVNGSTFATYNAGIRPFTAFNAATDINAAAAGDTVDVTAAMTTTSITASKTINALRFSDAAGDTIGGSAFTTLSLTAGGIIATGGGSNVISAPLLNTGATAVQSVFHIDGASTVLTIDSAITNNGGLVKAGSGTLVLSPNNVNGVSANTSTGTVTVAGGRLRIDNTNAIIPNQFLVIGGPGAEFDLAGNSQQIRGLLTDTTVDGSGGIITSSVGTGSLVINQDNNARTFAGSIQGNVNVTRSGENTLTIVTAQTYSGTTLINGNATTLTDGGTLAGAGALDINYATLNVNNTGTVNLTDRINDAKAITLRGGTLTINGRAQTASSEALGAVSLDQGFSVINANAGGTGVNSIDVSLASLSRPTGSSATLFVNGSTLGTIGSASRLTVATLNTVATAPVIYSANGSGLTNNIVGGWAQSNNDFLTYIPGLGLAELDQVGAAQYDQNNTFAGGTPTENIRLTATTTIPNGGANVNAVSMTGSNIALNFATGTDTLNITSGGLIGPNNNQSIGATVDSGRITAGGLTPAANSDLYIYNRANTLTLNSRIIDNPNTSSVRAVFTAAGGVISLTNTNASYTGGTVLNGGTLNLLASAAGQTIPFSTNGLVINNGTVTMGSSTNTVAQQIAAGNTVTMNGVSTLNLFGNNTFEGLVINNNGGGVGNVQVNTFSTATAAGTGSTGVLTIGDAGLTATSSNVSNTAIIVGRTDFGATAKTVNVAAITANGVAVAPLQATLQIQAITGTSGGITKTGNGVLQFNAQAHYSGPTDVQAGGIRTGVQNGGSRLSALTLGANTFFNINGTSTTWGSLAGSGTVFNTGGASTLTVGFDNTSTTFSGTLARFNDAAVNGVALQKVGTGTMTMTSAQSIATGTNGAITINGGTIEYLNAGAGFPGTAASGGGTYNLNEGGTLELDNTGTANVNHRLGLNVAGTLNIQGGNLTINGNSTAVTPTSEQITAFNVLNGGGRVDLTADPANPLTLAITTLNTANGTGALVIGGIDGAASADGVANLTITTPNFIGGQGGGANGTTTKTIRHDILVDNAVGGLGDGFLTQDSVTNNYRALQASELNTNVATWGDNQNAGLSSAQTLAANTIANSLTISGTASLGGLGAAFGAYGPGGDLLRMGLSEAAAALVLSGSTASINTGSLVSNSAGTTTYLHVQTGATLDLNAALGVGNTSGIMKAGGGTMDLSARAYYTGQTTINEGTVNLASLQDNTLLVSATGGAATVGNLAMNGTSATLNLIGRNQAVGVLSSINPLPGMGGTVTNTGPAATFSVNGTGTFGGTIAGNIAFTRAGNNTTTLTNASTYNGATIVRGGTLQLRDSGAISSTAGLTLNFGTLNWDNFGLNATANPTRVAANNPVTLRGGTFTINGAGSTDTIVTLNSVTAAGGQNTINTLPFINEGSTVKLTIGNLVRNAANRAGVTFNGFTTNNSTGANTLGGQGLTANSNVIINQLNGAAFSAASLVDNLIGGWAVADGSTFATYDNTFGVVAMGNTYGGFSAPAFSGTDISAATTATSNISDGSDRTITGAKVVNSLRYSSGTVARTLTLAAGATLTMDVGFITNTNAATTVAATDASNTITGGTGTTPELFFYGNQNTTVIQPAIINNGTNPLTVYSNGPGTLSLRPQFADNTYTGGTFAQAGTLNLQAAAGRIAIPGDLTITNAAVTMSTTPNQIAATSNVTVNGGGSLTFPNYTTGTTQTLVGIAFVNEGGAGNPTLQLGNPSGGTSLLILSSATPVTSTNNSLATTPTITQQATAPVSLQFSDANPVINVGAGLGATGLSIAAIISQHGSMTSLSKTGAGALHLSGQSTFTTGFNLNQGSLIFGANTTGAVTSGPVGTGTLTLAGGTTIQSDGTARTIANPVTVNGDVTIGALIAGTGVTLSGAVDFGAAARTITVPGVVSATISGAITSTATGATAFTKAGAGTLILSNAGNSLNGGGVAITGGILKDGVNDALPVATVVTISAGAGLDLNGFNQTIDSLNGGGFVTNSANSSRNLTISGATDGTFSGVITDNRIAQTSSRINLIKAGTNTQTLSGANAYGGTTTVNDGILRVGANEVIPNGSALTVNGTGTLDVFGFTETVASLAGNGTVTNTGGAAATLIVGDATNTTFSGLITDGANALNLTKQGTGTLILSNANSYDGVTNVTAGTLSITNSTALGTATGGTIVNGGTLQLSNNITVTGEALTAVGANGGAGALRNQADTNEWTGSVTITNDTTVNTVAGQLTLSGALGDGGVAYILTKTGTGTLVLSGASGTTFRSQIVIGAGVLSAGSSANLGDASATNTLAIAGATFQGTGTFDLGSNRTIALSGTGATLDITGSNNVTFSGAISTAAGTPSITKIGTGTATLSADNSGFAGPVSITGGTVSISASNNLGDESLTNNLSINGGTLQATATADITASRTVALGAGGGTFDVTGANELTVSGKVSGSSALTKTGTGTLVLSADNSTATAFTGQVVSNGGLVSVDSSIRLGDASVTNNIALNGGGVRATDTFDLGANRTIAIGASGGTLSVDSTKTLTASGSISGSAGLTKDGAGTLVLNADNSGFTGATTIVAGTVSAATANNIGGMSSINFNGTNVTLALTGSMSLTTGMTFTSNGTVDVSGAATTLTYTGTLGGTGGLTKAGAGTMLINSDNSAYTGPVTIAAGTFGGTGAVGGDVSVSAGATLAPGASIESLGMKSLALGNSALLSIELDLSNPGEVMEAIGASADLIQLSQIGGTVLSLGTGDNLSVTTLGVAGTLTPGQSHWTIATYESTGTWTGTFSVGGFSQTDYDFGAGPGSATSFEIAPGIAVSIDYDYEISPTLSAVALVVVPEPGSMASLAGAAGLLLGLQRFRRRTSKNA